MPRYLSIQQAPITDNITDEGHVGARLPLPVVADEEGIVYVPSSGLGMRRIHGFQNDLAVDQVDVWWSEVFADPSKAVGKYLVATYAGGAMCGHLSAVDSVEVLETVEPLPVER